MKKTFTLLFVFATALYGNAQIALDQNDFPGVGWEIEQMEAYDENGNVNFDDLIDFGTSGPSESYDISGIMPYVIESYQLTFVSPEFNEWHLHHPDAIAMLPDPDVDTHDQTGDTLAYSYEFYNFDGNRFFLIGKTFVLDSGFISNEEPSGEFDTLHISFELPELIASTEYLLGFNTTDSSFWDVSFGTLYHSETKVREIFVDGWGNLETPEGAREVLRVKVTERQSYLTTFDGVIEEEDVDTSYYYEFWAKQSGFPIATINVDESFEYAYSVDYVDVSNVSVSVDEAFQDISMEIYPNPATDFIYTFFDNSNSEFMNLSILNAQGQVVRQTKVDKYITKPIEVTALPKGIYFAKMTDKLGRGSTLSFVVTD